MAKNNSHYEETNTIESNQTHNRDSWMYSLVFVAYIIITYICELLDNACANNKKLSINVWNLINDKWTKL